MINFTIPSALHLHVEMSIEQEQIVSSLLTRSGKEGLRCTLAGAVSSSLVAAIERWLTDYAEGRQADIKLPLNFRSQPPFTRKVLDELLRLPFGATLSHGEVAAKIGQPNAPRAVGQACGRNPLILFVPCHRVLAANRRLGGFSSDPALKPLLLNHESVLLA